MAAKQTIKRAGEQQAQGFLPRIFSLVFGVLIGLCLVKFGNPCVFEKFIPWPENGFEWVLNSWPVTVGYWMLGVVSAVGLLVARWRVKSPRWVLALPLIWLGWQFISATQTLDAELTRLTLIHFSACVVCFYLGVSCLGGSRHQTYFWMPVVAAFLVVIAWGIQQRFGGLEETRKYFLTYIYPQAKSLPPEYLKKISSNRIFSTLFYPNALAGALLLLLPPVLWVVWRHSTRFTLPARRFLVAICLVGAIACLYWSGSKGGWLLMLILGLVALFHLRFEKRLRLALAIVLAAGGIAGFAIKYAVFFQAGSKSVHARFDYWNAAIATGISNPLLGTGPGTFGIAYKAIKKPGSEMARLTHNDYLEQLSDSGVIGFAVFIVWIVCVLWFGYSKPDSPEGILRFTVWLGVLGWSLHEFLEFGLYIPAIGWSAFTLSGWLVSQQLSADDRKS